MLNNYTTSRWRSKHFFKVFLGLFAFAFLISTAGFAQYNASHSGANAGNPGGINTESDFTTTGWTEVLPPSIPSNQWSAAFPISFPFNFYGSPVTHFRATGNGLVSFDTLNSTGTPANTPEALPSDSLPSNTIANYWAPFTNFAPTGTNDRVYWKEFGTAPNRQFWIRWHSYEYGSNGAFFYGSVVLEETSGKIFLVEMYGGSGVNGTSVGLQQNNTTGVTGSSSWNLQALGSGNGDNQYWQFSPPLADDIATTAVLSPTPGCFGNAENVSVELTNFGTNSIDFSTANTVVTVSVDTNGSPYATLSNTLTSGVVASGATTTAAMGTVDMSHEVTYSFTSSASMPGDLDGSNDTLTGTTFVNTVSFPLPQVVDFDSWNGFSNATLPPGWGETRGTSQAPGVGTASDWTTTTATQDAFLGSKSARINIFGTANPGEWILGPKFTTVTGTEVVAIKVLTMDFGGSGVTTGSLMGSDDTVSIRYSTDCGATWNGLKDFTRGDSADYNTGALKFLQYPIGAPIGTQVIVGVFATHGVIADPEDYYFYMDDLIIGQPITCPAPSGLAVGNIGFSTADFSWNSNATGTQWALEYGAPGYTAGTGTSSFYSSTTGTLTGLAPATGYDVYVREICGAGDSSLWIGPVGIFTNCAPFTAPYYDSLDGGTWAPLTTYDPCWGLNPTTGFRWQVDNNSTGSGGTGPTGDASGSGNYIYTEATSGGTGAVAEIYSPFIDISGLTAPELTFKYHMYGAAMGTLHVDIMDNGVWVNDVWTLSGQQQAASADPWLPASVILACAGITGDTIQLRFRGTRGTGFTSDMSVDEIAVDNLAPGTCPAPAAFTLGTVTSNSVGLSWGSCGPGTSFVLEYGAPGFTLGAGTGTTSSTNSTTITGLTDNTCYDVYVREVCSPGDSSAWVGPINFCTPCNPFVAPFFETFDTTVIPNCWSVTGNEPWLFNTNWTGWGASGLVEHTFGNNALSSFAGVDGSGGTTNDATLYSPLIDISGLSNPQLTFYVFSNNTDFPGDNATLNVEVDDGNGWDSLLAYAADDPNWVEVNLDLSAYSSPLQIRWNVDQTTMINSAFYNDIVIDDVSVIEAPTCPTPSAFVLNSVTLTSADISWTSNATGADWEIQYGVAGFTPGTGMFMNTTATTANITGLSASTTYDVYIREICGVGDTSMWLGPNAFTTALGNPTSCNLNYLLPDGNGPNWENVDFIVSAPGSSLGTDVVVSAVNIVMDHTYTSDVVMELVSPAGDTVLLFDQHGGSGDHFGLNNGNCDTVCSFVLDTTGATPIAAGSTPFIGNFIPDELLDGFHTGGNPNGTWTLRYQDNFNADQGTLQYFEIVFGIVNDDVCNAVELNLGDTASYTNTGGTAQAGEPIGSCWTDGGGTGALENTVWFYFVAAQDGAYFVSTNFPPTPNNDTQIAAYLAANGCSDFTQFTEIGCGEDIDATNWLSEMTTNAVAAGDTVYIQVDGWAGTVGQFDISVSYIAPPVAGFTFNVVTGTTVAFSDASLGTPTSWFWDFDDGQTATTATPLNTYASLGSYDVKLVVSNSSGSDSVTQTVNLTGLNNSLNQNVNIFPNPANSELNIEVVRETIMGYSIIDVMGREVLSSDKVIIGNDVIDVSEIVPGNYLLKLKFENEFSIQRISIQR